MEEETGQILWSDVWNGAEKEIFDMQSSLLEKVEATVTPGWTGVIPQERMARLDGMTRDVGAYDLFLRAIEQKHQFTPAALAQSQRYLEQSLALDGDFARAWTALAIVHLLQMEHASSRSDFEAHLARRITATRRAMELAPNDPETLIQSTFLLGREKDHVAAEAALRRAVELGWNNPDILAQAAWGGSRRVPVGADAVRWAKRALDLNPSPPPWYFAGLATAAFHAGDYELAAEAYAKAPPVTEVLYRRAATEAHLGRLDAARLHLSQSLAGLPDGMTIRELEAADGSNYPPYVEMLGSLLEKIGDA